MNAEHADRASTDSGATLLISHTPASGTLLTGSRRGDGVNHILRGVGANWRWSRNIGEGGAFYIPRTRDQVFPKSWEIEQTAVALRSAGHTVTVETGTERRTAAEQEAERTDRTEARVERLDDRAQRRAEASEAAGAVADRISAGIPLGQPILLGHHSQRRAERDRDRIHANTEKAVQLGQQSREATRQATEAAAGHRERLSGPATMRRIDTLGAEQRDLERKLNGGTRGRGAYSHEEEPASGQRRERLQALLDDIADKLRYWGEHLDALQASGEYKLWTRADFTKGDWVKFHHGWAPVLTVNAKSLSVPHPIGLDTMYRVPYDRVTDRRSKAEIEAAAAQATPDDRP